MSNESPKRTKWTPVLLVLLPVWLIASGGIAIWYYVHREKQEAQIEQERFSQAVSAPMMADDLRKLVEVIGERHGGSEEGAKNLSRTSSMIQGLLGPANTGYAIQLVKGPADWPLIQVTLRGKNPDLPAIWVISSLDSRPGSPGAEANATGLAATIAAAQALAGEKPEMNLHFVLLPHANDPESPILETATLFQEIVKAAGPPKAVICVEAMGAGSSLWISSRDTDALPMDEIKGLGEIKGAEVVCLGEDVDLASILVEMGLPAVRVATRPIVTADEPDATLPSPAVISASTGRLVELIRRCAGL